MRPESFWSYSKVWNTLPIKSLDTPSHSVFLLYFLDFPMSILTEFIKKYEWTFMGLCMKWLKACFCILDSSEFALTALQTLGVSESLLTCFSLHSWALSGFICGIYCLLNGVLTFRVRRGHSWQLDFKTLGIQIMTRTNQLSKDKLQSIRTLKTEGQSVWKIAKALNMSSSAAVKNIKHYNVKNAQTFLCPNFCLVVYKHNYCCPHWCKIPNNFQFDHMSCGSAVKM